jgi:hypothetical protein
MRLHSIFLSSDFGLESAVMANGLPIALSR